jgi:predicted dehydrogenase
VEPNVPDIIRWGFVGTNSVAASMALAISRTDGHRLVSVTSGQRQNAEKFAAMFGARVASNVEELAGDAEVTCVYVASPTSSHEEHALTVLAAGKSVLLEKPFTVDAASAERVVQKARESGLLCMEAAWTRFLPLVMSIRQLVADGAIGTVRQLNASFCRADSRDPTRNMFRPDRGGGALLQRGFYGITLARHLLGPVEDVKSVARIGPTGVDEDCVLTMVHQSGALSVTRASMVSSAPHEPIMLQGETGSIRIDPPLFRPSGARIFKTSVMTGAHAGGLTGSIREKPLAHLLRQRLEPLLRRIRPGGSDLARPYIGNGYDHQILAFGEALRAGLTECPIMPLDETLQVMRIFDAARKEWGTVP